ncbi:hypothetical protein IF188_16865 [Microbacterium sp. NEAU-LLC]|uniref:3-oxoacyl-ACP reductase n=1 Tax=Microbacterium helvum TaxID=2773713 RepID=A0ABR8NRW9_9MICO|nr:hypothetical protein [Microbacterium helvum]MBD3943365.1 hypothetical protein [Microbacterium helvum]
MNASPVSSTPILRTVLVWSGSVTAILAVVGAVVGFLVAGVDGLWSALAGVLIAALFLGITAASILIANRWFGDALYVPIFFGIVLGGWILKFVVFLIALFVLRGQPWIEPPVFFVALVVSVLASLAIDVIALVRMRVPVVDVELPSDPDAGERTDDSGAGA